jgi:hypothetical protein
MNPGDTGLADVSEPHAARAGEVKKMHMPTSARNRARRPIGIVWLPYAALSKVAGPPGLADYLGQLSALSAKLS